MTFEDYILYGTQESISIKQCIQNEFLIILLSLPLIIFERTNYVFLILAILPMLCYFMTIIFLIKERKMQGVYYILHNGIFSVCVSLLFGLSGMGILLYLFKGSKRIFLLCTVSIGYIAAARIYGYIIKKMMEKKEFDGLRKVNGGFFFLLSGVLGISVARIFLKDISNETALEILCIACFFLSYLSLLGTFNLIKFQYIMKHKEMLK